MTGPRRCLCPEPNYDCQHPTCPRYPQPGHYEAMLRAVLDLHVAEHRYCVVCDEHRDVEAVGNNPSCPHWASACRACDQKYPCPTRKVIDL